MATPSPNVKGFFDPATNTVSYVVSDPQTQHCAIIDSVLDLDYAAGDISYEHADEIIAYVKAQGLTLDWLVETHVHADHLSAAPYIQQVLGGQIAISREITQVQDIFGKCSMPVLNLSVTAGSSTNYSRTATLI